MTAPPVSPVPTGPIGPLLAALREQGGTSIVCAWLMAALPSIDGVALTVFTAEGRVVVSAAGIGGDRAEDLQITVNEGPCLDAAHNAQPIGADDLTDAAARQRWPRYASQAVAAGFSASFAFPVLLQSEVIGVMSLFRSSPGPLTSDEHAQTLLYTGAATALLSDDVTAGGSETGARVDSSVADLQQATGVVMTQADVDADVALHLIRQYAFDHTRPAADIVVEILARDLRFDPTP